MHQSTLQYCIVLHCTPVNPLRAHDNRRETDRYTAVRPLMGELLHLVQRGGDWASCGCGPAQSPLHCTKCNGPPINRQCTDLILFDVAL